MAIRRRRSSKLVLTSILILMTLLSPLTFIQASRFSFQGETLMTKETTLNEHNVEQTNVAETSLQTGVLAGIGLDDSERQVPTGPDPLHHNQAPLEP